MSSPTPMISIPVDLTNPGQFFACLNLPTDYGQERKPGLKMRRATRRSKSRYRRARHMVTVRALPYAGS